LIRQLRCHVGEATAVGHGAGQNHGALDPFHTIERSSLRYVAGQA
jgi:hypothetical protein